MGEYNSLKPKEGNKMDKTKKMKEALKLVESKEYEITEALNLIQKLPKAKLHLSMQKKHQPDMS